MITELGKMLRKIRIRNGDCLADMAHKLGVYCSSISDFETGRKHMSNRQIETVARLYHLTVREEEELKRLARDS